MKSIEMVKRRQSESAFYLGTSTNGHMIAVNVMSGFIQKYFLQNPWNLKNSLVAKQTIGGGTLGRPLDSWVAFGDWATILQQHWVIFTIRICLWRWSWYWNLYLVAWGVALWTCYSLTHWGRHKMATFPGRHFQMHFPEWKCLNLKYNSTEMCSQGSNWQ